MSHRKTVNICCNVQEEEEKELAIKLLICFRRRRRRSVQEGHFHRSRRAKNLRYACMWYPWYTCVLSFEF